MMIRDRDGNGDLEEEINSMVPWSASALLCIILFWAGFLSGVVAGVWFTVKRGRRLMAERENQC
jgi:hypothetical protein